MNLELRHSLTRELGERVCFDEPMERHTTWRAGGPVWGLAEVQNRAESRFVLEQSKQAGKALKPLGRGSNLLVSDRGYDGLMLKLGGALGKIEAGPSHLLAGGGAAMSAAVKQAAVLGLSGLEWAVGIPCTVGGAVATNAGALGCDMAQIASRLTLLLADGSVESFEAGEFAADYRRRELPAGSVVLQVELALQPGDSEAVQARTRANLERRRQTQPLDRHTCGSVFKNPPGDFAARLIEQAGLKGMRIGGARVSPKHANFIENQDNATAGDILALIKQVADLVHKRFGVRLEAEVELLGDV